MLFALSKLKRLKQSPYPELDIKYFWSELKVCDGETPEKDPEQITSPGKLVSRCTRNLLAE